MYLLYSLCLALVYLGALPGFLIRRVWRGGHPLALGERFGFVPLRPGPPRLWVHAVSVGEAMAAIPLVRALKRRWPETEIVVSTVTGTGARVARDRLPEASALITFPLDFSSAVRRAVARIEPRGFIALETELWPNLLRTLARRGIPAVVVNGRISDRSYRRYRLVRRLFRRTLGEVAGFGMQSEEDARRIIALGASPERVVVTGNLKMEAAGAGEGTERLWRRLLHLTDAEPVWIAGSTHRGEEEQVLEAYTRLRREVGRLSLILAPRHPERVGEIEALLTRHGLRGVRRTRLSGGREAGLEAPVILLDTVGELASLYTVADVIFIGGSLVPAGGHNMIEPASMGKPVVFGTHVENFREVAALLLEAGGAIQVRGRDELTEAVRRLLLEPEERQRRGAAAQEAVRAQQGAAARTLELLERAFGGA